MLVHLTKISGNSKTGPIPVSTTERDSCPPTCSFYASGCYAKGGPLGIHWSQVSKGKRGSNWAEFLEDLKTLPKGQLWRHNQAGDLPGKGLRIAAKLLGQLVDVNAQRKLKGFTYTHKPLTPSNAAAIADANLRGFVINLSADSLAEADEKYNTGLGPVVVVLPIDAETGKRYVTPQGHKVVTCPATIQGSDLTCARCQLCAIPDRKSIIGFPAHGVAKRKVNAMVSEIKG
jgi:hypothetical protein